jgi:NADPH:quinone reductase-like Zn-dependent oxidoreductase
MLHQVAFAGFDGGPDKGLQEVVTLSYTKVGKVSDSRVIAWTDRANHNSVDKQIPQSVSFEEAASIPDNFVTAWFTLVHSLGLTLALGAKKANAADPIFIYGAGGSVGQYCIQLLKATGYTNVFATASPKHHEYLRKIGATHVFDYKTSSLTKGILAGTNGAKFKYVVNCVATQPSFVSISEVVEKGSKVTFLLPIKEGSDVVGTKLLWHFPKNCRHFPKESWLSQRVHLTIKRRWVDSLRRTSHS